ncbi:MAG: elongation factor G [Planctomycetes bacterium]|nr:elongation factor G [Planctomycetota bacterium]MCC7397809.1 elongation factor G [Planctomycetota bacterium]
MVQSSENLRNVALIGHGHSGKTALVDAIAHHAKLTTRLGSVADGSSISNTEPEEKERKQTLAAHLFRIPLGPVVLNLFDTPGHPDFVADAISTLDVVETIVLVVNASNPLTFHARQLWQQAGAAGVGRAIVVTHLDSEGATFEQVVAQLREAFGHAVVPASYPNRAGAAFSAVHSVTHTEGPDGAKYHDMIEEDEAEVDDTLMEHYLESGHLDATEFEENLRRAVARGKLVPVFAVCPNRGLGLEQLLEFVQLHFPSPVCFGARGAKKPGGDSASELVEPGAGPFAAKVWKAVSDPYVGRLAYARCYRGTLKKDQSVFDVRTGKSYKVAHLLEVNGKDTKEVNEVVAGDLFAISKVEELSHDDSLTAEGAAIEFPRTKYPQPSYSRHVWPKSRADEQKIGHAIERLCSEDPTLHHNRDKETGEFLVTGMSPIHLEILFQRLQRRHQVAVDHGPPTIPYRETITARADGHHRHKKQTGGRGQFAEVYLRVAPLEHGKGFEYVDSVVGGSIPRQFIPEVEKGARKFLTHGGLAGFPVVDMQVEVYEGKYHDVDSDQLSFQIAGERAVHDAFEKARPILLEPIMDVEIRVPDRFTGDVAGNLSANRGRMSGMEMADGVQVIRAECPLSTMLDYSTQLRSMTAGEGTFTMTFAHYEAVPPNLQHEIVAKRKAAAAAAAAQPH